MLHLSPSCRYYLYAGNADMRKGFNSLSGMVSSQMQLNVLDGSVFIFMNKKHNQIKLLLWEGDGFALYHKRLEKGTYELPSTTNESSSIAISAQQLQFILQGISLQKIHFRLRYKRTA
ncbi:MAG TPA: IS66 family insertion sequence element accessory protein TnpB [Chitinophagaceae bacterium]|nr:IS66 family insertion sequence element accessory protein TnpB [Chitinophagaceae bacterium]